MTPNLFSDLVKQHFSYLLNDYGFAVADERYYPQAMGNAEVWLKSNLVGLRIVLDRGQVLVSLGPLSQPERDWFELYDVIRFFSPSLNVYEFPEDFSDYKAALETQIKRLALVILHYCDPLLRSDFSMQEKIRDVETKQVEELLGDLNKMSQEYHKSGSAGQ